MSPLVAYHSTARRHREAIHRYGLIPALPSSAQWFGVYVYRDDYTHRTRHMRYRSGIRPVSCWWAHRPPNDLWEVAYIGPLYPDQFVANALVLSEPPEHVSLVSPLSRVTS